jgi:hypothetical protein
VNPATPTTNSEQQPVLAMRLRKSMDYCEWTGIGVREKIKVGATDIMFGANR